MDIVNVLDKVLARELESNGSDDDFFSSDALTATVARIVSNYVTSRIETKESRQILRILQPHGFDGQEFDDCFGINDVLYDLRLYRDRGYVFSHYELSEQTADESGTPIWKIIGSFQNCDVLFFVKRDISPERHHVNKIFYKEETTDGDRVVYVFHGKRVFPSSE